jgi:hemolysin activation/secretion protein
VRSTPFAVSTAVAAAWLAMPMQAVVAQTPPPGAQVAPPTRDELIPPQQRREREGTTLTIDGGLERAPCALDRPDYADIRLTLSSVTFTGLDRAPGVSLSDAYQAYLGRELPLAVLCDIRAQANAILRDQGYLAAVEIPEQRLSGGAAEFRVVFGRLTALRVRGDAGPSETLVANYLQRLTQEPVFNTRDAERYLLLADDLPGLNVRLSLRPAAGGAPGDLTGEVAVVRQRGFVDVNVQNYGSKAIGRFGGLLRGEIYDVTGMGDRTSLALFSTLEFEEQHTAQFAHDFRVGSQGLRFGGAVTYSVTNPAIDLPGFNVESETILASLRASYPLRRSRATTVIAETGFDYVDQDVDVNDILLTRDRVRTLFARVSGEMVDRASIARAGGYSEYEPRRRFAFALEARQGIDVFEASPDCRANPLACVVAGGVPPSRIEADPTPLLLRAATWMEFRPIPNLTFALDADAQVTSDPLPAFEEFAAGNYSIGRGYDPGAVLGDNGVGVSFEARVGSLAPKTATTIAWQPYVFTDAAWAWNRDPSRRPLNPDRLWSAGGGVRAAWGSRLQGDLTVAVPLQRPDLAIDRGDVRVMFSLTARLLPWRF